MTTNNRSSGWAIAILCIGFAGAYPFLQKSNDNAPTDVGTANDFPVLAADVEVNDLHSSPLAEKQNEPVVRSFSNTQSVTAASVVSRRVDSDLKRPTTSLPSTAILAPALPEWAKPATELDALVAAGARTLAGQDSAQELRSLPSWVNTNDTYTNPPSNSTSAHEAPNGWHSSLHSSPFDAPASDGSSQTINRPALDWPDQNFSQLKQSPENKGGFEAAPDSFNQRQVGNLISNSAGHESAKARHSLRRETADRRKRFVYQPGHRPDREE